MSGWVDIKVDGLDELKRNLDKLSGDIRLKGGERSCRAGAAEIRKAMIEECKSETLRQTMKIVKVHKKGNPKAKYFITHKKKGDLDPFFAHLMEYGPIHKPGGWDIKPRKAKALGYKGRFGKHVRHPGFQPKPYMRPGFDNSKEDAINEMAKRLRRFIEKGK